MKEVIRFQANDGSEWVTKEQAVARDILIGVVEQAMSKLKQTPKEMSWEGYVQQDPTVVRQCKEALFKIANTDGVLKWWIDAQKKDHGKTENDLIDVHPSWFSRMLDGSHRPLDRAYGRLCAIDEQCREWEQPYYAMNPGKGKDICVA